MIVVMSIVAITVLGITIAVLYTAVYQHNRAIMLGYVDHQANALKMAYQMLEPAEQRAARNAPPEKILKQVRDIMRNTPNITATGEMLIAYRDGDRIRYLTPLKMTDRPPSDSFANDDPVVETMLRALNGERDSGISIDYRGKHVLSAFRPIPDMNLALEIKVDMDELREPFATVALIAVLATLGIISIGIVILSYLSRPLVRQLQENELKYRTLFESANEGVMLVSDRIEECNDQLAKLLGYSKTEIIGHRIADFSPQRQPYETSSQDLIHKRFEQARQGKPQYFVWRGRRRDGSEVDFDTMLKAINLGNRTLVLTTLLDVTDRRRAELELRRRDKEMADAREHLTHMARLSMLGEMAAGIAHEINQPLTAIATYAQASQRMLNNGLQRADELRDPFEKISTQAIRAGEVIRRLRGFIKKSAREMEQVDVNNLVAEIVELAEVDSQRHAVPIHTHFSAVPAIWADAVQLQQVLLNLIRNALEAMEQTPKAQARVDLYTRPDPLGVAIEVADTGPGLTEAQSRHLFDPFFTTKQSGMGLGLSISHSIIEAHGGNLSVNNNTHGRGCTFTIRLKALRDCSRSSGLEEPDKAEMTEEAEFTRGK